MSHTLARQTNTWTPFPAYSLPGLPQPPGGVPPGSGQGEGGGVGGVGDCPDPGLVVGGAF